MQRDTSRVVGGQFGLCGESVAQHADLDLTTNINPQEGGRA